MKNLILNNAAIVAKDRAEDSSRIIIAEGKVAFGSPSAIAEPVAEIDVGGSLVTPGFIDIHNHGAVGVEPTICLKLRLFWPKMVSHPGSRRLCRIHLTIISG